VEDVDEAEEEEEAGEEMTDNTPETRVKVSYTTCSCVVVLLRMGNSLPHGPPGALGWWNLLGPRSNNTPLTSTRQIYQELAQQKKEKEDRANVNAPKKRDFEAEQAESIRTVREKEAEAEQA
jgi:hypothetical protein